MIRTENQSVIDDVINNVVIAPISTTHIELATKIAERVLGVRDLDLTYYSMDPRRFTVGEFCPKFIFKAGQEETLRGKSVYIIVNPGPYKDQEGLVKRAEMVAEAARIHGARKIVLLATDLPHARQDRGPDEDPKAVGELNTVRLHARTFEVAGIEQIITTHPHSPRLAALYALEYGLTPKSLLPENMQNARPRDLRVPEHFDANDSEMQKLGLSVFKGINPYSILADYMLFHSWLAKTEEGQQFLKNDGAKLALKALDKGNRPGRDFLYDALFLPNAVKVNCDKARKAKNDPHKVEVPIVWVSDNFTTLDGMCEVLADDGADTCGTLIKSSRWSDEGNICATTGEPYGSPSERFVYFTHAWLGGESYQSVQAKLVKDLSAREFVTTNSRPYISDGQYYRFKAKSTVLRLAGLWADAILANEMGHDITTRYTGFESKEQQHEFLGRLYAIKRHSRHFMESGTGLEKREVSFALR